MGNERAGIEKLQQAMRLLGDIEVKSLIEQVIHEKVEEPKLLPIEQCATACTKLAAGDHGWPQLWVDELNSAAAHLERYVALRELVARG